MSSSSLPLATGATIPTLGFGTWQISDGAPAYDATAAALRAGYRHVDSARAYGNEANVGRAVRDSGLSRGEVFVGDGRPRRHGRARLDYWSASPALPRRELGRTATSARRRSSVARGGAKSGTTT